MLRTLAAELPLRQWTNLKGNAVIQLCCEASNLVDLVLC